VHEHQLCAWCDHPSQLNRRGTPRRKVHRDENPSVRLGADCRTISTGRAERLATRSAVEPVTTPRKKPAPRVPVTSRSASIASASRASSWTGFPMAICSLMLRSCRWPR
jgi:hypothetical protein